MLIITHNSITPTIPAPAAANTTPRFTPALGLTVAVGSLALNGEGSNKEGRKVFEVLTEGWKVSEVLTEGWKVSEVLTEGLGDGCKVKDEED